MGSNPIVVTLLLGSRCCERLPEIVRALETHWKVVSWKIDIEFCQIMGLQLLYNGKTYATNPLIECWFVTIVLHVGPFAQ